MKKAEIKRRKRVVPNHLVNDDQSSVYTAENAEEDRHSIPPHTEAPSPPFSQTSDSKSRLAGGPIPVDFTDAFRARQNPTSNNGSKTSPSNPRKRSFSAASQDHPMEPYPHAQNMGPSSDDNIDPALPAQNREPSTENPRQDRDARRALLEAEAEKMRVLLHENQRKLEALAREE